MQELGKFNVRVNIIPNVLERYISFTINNKLIFINGFQVLSSSLDSLVKSLDKYDFEYLSQEFDKNKSDLVKKKGFCHFEKFKKKLPCKILN